MPRTTSSQCSPSVPTGPLVCTLMSQGRCNAHDTGTSGKTSVAAFTRQTAADLHEEYAEQLRSLGVGA